MRARLGSGRTAGSTAHRAPRTTPRGRIGGAGRAFGGHADPTSRTGPPTTAGRWSLLPERTADPTLRATARAQTLLDRHGVVTRGAVAAERVPGGFAAAYRVLSAFEEKGRARRGYAVDGLGAAQFATDGAVDRLRAVHNALDHGAGPGDDGWSAPAARPGGNDRFGALVLAAADPANAYGAALPWPDPPGAEHAKSAHKPGRKAGALVVLVAGQLVLYVERGGKSLLAWTDDPEPLQRATDALALAVREGALGKVTVERANGEAALTSPFGKALEAAGFHPTPRGLRLRG
jgi:ATP-dependent Lhr-like helicase